METTHDTNPSLSEGDVSFDDQLVHKATWHNIDRALCGKDLSGCRFVSTVASAEMCVVCADLAQAAR